MSVTYVDHSYQGPLFLKSPRLFLVATLGFGFLFTLPVYWDYQFTQKALPYQGYVLSSQSHITKNMADYYELNVQFKPPGQKVRQLPLKTYQDYPVGSMIPIAYDPHPGGDVRELGPKMSLGREVLPPSRFVALSPRL